MEKWEPKASLLMETRRLPRRAKFDSWPDMQKTWSEATAVDGAGFVSFDLPGWKSRSAKARIS